MDLRSDQHKPAIHIRRGLAVGPYISAAAQTALGKLLAVLTGPEQG
jgi:hypothetical protein